jgi:enterochelin esterase-like enzyme
MKRLLLATLLFALPALAQPVVSPEVHPDRRVTFRLAAPNAKEVQLRCEGITKPTLQRDEQGVWTFTSEPLEPDIYVYSFSVDGVRVVDPANPLLKCNLLNTESQVYVPGPKSLAWELNDVPHGVLHRHFYRSAAAGDERDFLVYTPPGYDPTAKQLYPVLYLLHGYSDDPTAWSAVGRANVILDNLIARGQARPMIVVMPLGYGTMDIVKAGWSRVRDRELWQRNVDRFGDALLGEVLPQVEKAYRASPDRQARAIAGLSMGGTESLVVGLNHLDRFAWIGAFSSGGLSTNFAAQFPALDAKASDPLRLLWIACGREDRLIDNNRQLCDWLKSKSIRYTWVESDGAHSFRVWRRYLADFAPLLFHKGVGP